MRKAVAEPVTQCDNRALSVGEMLIDASTDEEAKGLRLAAIVTDEMGEPETESSADGESEVLEDIEALLVIVTKDVIVKAKTDTVVTGLLEATFVGVGCADALNDSTIEDDASIERVGNRDDDAAGVVELKPEALKPAVGDIAVVPVSCADIEVKCVVEGVPEITGDSEPAPDFD